MKEVFSIVQNKEPRGRFLKKVDAGVLQDSGFDPGAKVWCLVVHDVALKKVKQALRQIRDKHLVRYEVRHKLNDMISHILQSQKHNHHHNWHHQEQFPFAFGDQGTLKKRTGEIINPASHNQLMTDSSRNESRRHNMPGHTMEFTDSVFKKGYLK